VLALEAALGIAPKESLPHISSFFLSRQQKSLKDLRRKFQALARRHEQRCEALYYGLGVVKESDTYRAPAEKRALKKRRSSEASGGRELEDNGRTVEDVTVFPREEFDTQVGRPGEKASDEEGLLGERDKAQEAGALEWSKT